MEMVGVLTHQIPTAKVAYNPIFCRFSKRRVFRTGKGRPRIKKSCRTLMAPKRYTTGRKRMQRPFEMSLSQLYAIGWHCQMMRKMYVTDAAKTNANTPLVKRQKHGDVVDGKMRR